MNINLYKNIQIHLWIVPSPLSQVFYKLPWYKQKSFFKNYFLVWKTKILLSDYKQ